jgi:hypothetical protein
MAIQPSDIANSISQKYWALHAAFNDLANEAAQYHGALLTDDNPSRGLFNALSRMLAFSDQAQLTLSLMGEDVHKIEAAYGDKMGEDWTQQLQDCFDECFTNMNSRTTKVH